jgi:hypothetical protein
MADRQSHCIEPENGLMAGFKPVRGEEDQHRRDAGNAEIIPAA